MEIRTATDADWPGIFEFYSVIMAEGRTYAFPEQQSREEAKPWWMEQPPGHTVVAVEGATIVGSAKMGQPAQSRFPRRHRLVPGRPATAEQGRGAGTR